MATGSICPYRNNLELNCQRPLSTIDRYYHSMSCNSCTWLRTRPTCSGAPDLMRDDETRTRTRTRKKRSTFRLDGSVNVEDRIKLSKGRVHTCAYTRVRVLSMCTMDPLKNHYGQAISAWHFFYPNQLVNSYFPKGVGITARARSRATIRHLNTATESHKSQ